MSRNSPAAAVVQEPVIAARCTSLDVLRGLTIAGMIVVNNQGDGAHVLPGLGHAKWNGIGIADLVFPAFLVIVGVSMAFSFGRRRPTHDRILRRSVVLFALGFFLNAFPHFDPSDVHIMGVLQRIGLVYLLASLVVLHIPKRSHQYAVGAALLFGYWALMTLVPVPGHGDGVLTPEGNLAGWLDRTILGVRHVYNNGPYDPQGLLSTLPAVVTALIGFWVGDWVRRQRVSSHVPRRVLVFGVVLLAAGAAWHPLFPLNKRLWTSSYVLFTAGTALLLFAVAYQLVDVWDRRRAARPFEVLGLNAILAYVVAEELHFLLGTPTHLRGVLYRNVFAPLAGPELGSLAFSLAVTSVIFVVALAFYRRRIFLKV